MKHLMKVSLMALVAMFAFNTTADAQFGGLLKKAKAAVGGKSSADSYMEREKQLDEVRKQRAEKAAAETAAHNEANKQVQIKNWKTGGIDTVDNPFTKDGKVAAPITSATYYKYEKNFSDKAMKKKIIEAFLDDEKFNNRKRESGDLLKDRKVVEVVFLNDGWKINRNNLDDIVSRTIEISVISETTNGYTVCDDYYVNNTYTGGGTYEDSFKFKMHETYKGAYGKDGEHRWFVTDWEHKDNADPLAGL